MEPAAAVAAQSSTEKGAALPSKKAVKENANNSESADGKPRRTGQATGHASPPASTAPAPVVIAEAGENSPTDGGEISTAREPRRTRKGGLSQELRERVKTKYQPKTANLMVRYNKLGSQFADFSNNVAFLGRCSNMMMVPTSHRVYNSRVRNTRVVVRLLDECSFRVMIADLEHNRRRKYQVMRNRERVELRLMEIMSPEDFEEVRQICHENREVHFADVKERQRKEYQDLLDEYKTHETKKNRRRRLDSHRTNGDSSASPGPADQGDQGDEGHETTKSSAANAIAASGREQTSPPSSAAAAAAAGPKNRDKGKDKEAPGTASVKPPKPQGNTTSTATTDQSRV